MNDNEQRYGSGNEPPSDSRHVTLADMTDPGPWWIAHEHPERPVDAWCVASWDCDACVMVLIAGASVAPDYPSEEFVGNTRTRTTIADTLAAARAWRAEHGLRGL